MIQFFFPILYHYCIRSSWIDSWLPDIYLYHRFAFSSSKILFQINFSTSIYFVFFIKINGSESIDNIWNRSFIMLKFEWFAIERCVRYFDIIENISLMIYINFFLIFSESWYFSWYFLNQFFILNSIFKSYILLSFSRL